MNAITKEIMERYEIESGGDILPHNDILTYFKNRKHTQSYQLEKVLEQLGFDISRELDIYDYEKIFNKKNNKK